MHISLRKCDVNCCNRKSGAFCCLRSRNTTRPPPNPFGLKTLNLIFHNYRYTENLVIFYNKQSFAKKLNKNDFSQCYEKYEGANTYKDCEAFLTNEVTQWFKKGRQCYNVTVIFQENKEICSRNVSTIMDFIKLYSLLSRLIV